MADYIFLKKNGKGADIKVSRQDFAKNPNAYRDYTVRMVDKDGSNWDVPFNHINDAVKDGAHVFNMRENTPQQKTTIPAPQPKSAVAQQAVNFTQKPAQPYQPTWQEQAGMSMAVDQAASMGGSDVQPIVKPGLDTNILNQNNALANRAMATNLESNQDNLYLDELEKQAIELQRQGQAEVEKQQEGKGFLGNAFDAITGARTGTSQYQSNLQANDKMRQGTAIQKNVDDARKAIKDAEISQNGSWYQKLGRGLANGFDVRNFDLGLTDLQNALTLRSAVNNPNDVNNAVLDSEALKNKIIKENEDKISNWITAGETTTMMVPFMVQIASSPFGGLGTAASKWAMSKVGQEIAGSLGKRAALLALKGTTRFLGDAVEGAGTSAFFNTAGITADAMRRQRGNAVGQYGSDGYFHYNEMKDGEDSYAKAFAKAFGASAIEYQSELVGEYFSPLLKGIGKVAGKGLQKAGVLGVKEGFDTTGKKFTNIMLNFGGKNVSLDKTIGMITALSNKQYLKAFNDFTKATRWNGVIGEYAEEVVGNIENAALIGDMNWGTGKNGVFNPEQNWETFLSVAVGSGFMGALGGVFYMGSRLAVNRGLKKSDEMGTALFGADAWRSIKDGFETADNPARFLASISQNLDEPSKRAIQNYAAYSMAKKGELVADMKQRMEEPQPTNVRITPYKGRFVVQSVDPSGNIIESKDYDSEEDANIYKERVATYIDNARKVQAYNDFILRGDIFDYDYDTYALLQKIAYKDPLKRTDDEQEFFDNFINSTENITYPTNEVHEEHDAQKGADLAEETSENIVEGAKPLNDREAAAKTRWNAVVQSQPDIDSLVGTMVNQGMTSNEIAQRLVDDYGGESEVVEAFCELCNAKANKDGYINRIGQLIQSKVENDIDEASFAGTVNGNEDKSNIYLLTNGTNTFALIGGDITVDSNNNISSNGIAIMLDGQGNRMTRPDLTGFSLKGIVDKNQYKRSSLLELQQEATAAIQATEIPIQLFNNSDIDTLSPEMPNNNGLTAPEVPQQEQPQEQPQAQAEEQPQEQPATPENTSPIPLDEKGKRLYHKAPIEATINDLYDGALEDEEIRDFVQNNINKSAKDYDKAIKKKPDTGTDKDAYLQAKQAWQQQVDEAKQKLDYWNSVNDYIQQQTHTTPEEIQKTQDELSGKTAQQEYAKNKPDMSVTPVQFAGEFIRESKIQTQSFYNETGFGDAERKKFPKMIANDGKTIDSLAEELVSADDTYHNGSLYHGDTTEAKNAILEALQTASKKSELGKNTSDDFKEYERQREEDREAFYEENFNMSYSDYLAFEEQQMPNIWRRMSNFVAEEYDRIVNESYEMRDEQNNVEQINNENNGNNTEGNRQLAGGSEVLPTERSNQQGGTSTTTNPAAETTNGSEGGNQNEEVPGGAQGVEEKKTLNKEEADYLISLMKLNAEIAEEVELSPENWISLFGEDGTINTPIGQVKMGEGQYFKLAQQGRDGKLGMVKPTLENPVVVIEEERPAKNGVSERNTSYIFVKTFKKADGSRLYYFTSVTVSKDGKEVVISNQEKSGNRISKLLQQSKIAWINPEFSLHPNTQIEESVPLNDSNSTTSTDNDTALLGVNSSELSEGKDTTKSPNSQENQQKSDEKVEEPQKEDVPQPLTEADIDADEIADEYSKELAKEFLRGENTGTIAELFYREIAGRVQKKGEKKEEKKPYETKPSNTPPTGQAESDKPKSEPKEKKLKTETPKTSEQKTSLQQALDEFKDVMRQFRDAGRMDASVSLVGLNSRQIEMLGKVFRATAKLGYEIIKKGATSFENWLETMKAQVADIIKVNSNWNDQDITDLLTEAWNNKYPVDGVYKPLSQWAAEEALAAEQKQEEQKQEAEQPAETPEAQAAEQTKVAERKFVDNVATTLTSAMETGEKPYASIVALRKAAREAGMEVGENGETDIKIQELVEDALVRVAKNIMTTAHIAQVANKANNKFAKEIFDKIKLLYNLQPTISMRSSNRIALQQYSTPLPMAFVADMFATGAKAPLFFNVFEPTAGNGMLVFAIPSSQVHVNEIDENRLDNLRGQEFRQVTTQDATQPFAGDRKYNAIITNPPFGSTEAKDYDGYSISGLAPQIALNALDKMKDNGKAVIIIGGKQEFAPNGAIKNDKPFLAYLYNNYNVKGVIDMDGSLYAKQGTTFPTRMILIDGRRTEEERAKSDVYPPTIKNWINPVADFDRLYDTVNDLINSKEKTNGTEIVHAKDESLQSDRSVTLPGNTDKGTDSRKPVQDVATTGRGLGPNRGNGKSPKRDNTQLDLFGGVLGGSGGLSDNPENESGTGGGSGRRTGRDNGPGGKGVDNRLPVDNLVSGVQGTATRGVGLTQEQENRKLDSEKLPYRPHNGAFSLESLAPAAMVEAMDKTLKRIEEEYGNIDEFVTNELGYDSIDAMHKALAAEQVDSVAMAIYNMKKGEALIIGDQTGVGKGRQMAALIRWAHRQGKKPIFMTQKSNLFNDIYRDLKDIGSESLKPFIFNDDSDAKIVEIYENDNGDEKQKIIYRSASKEEINKALKSGKIPDDCDFVLCTYSQISTGDETSKEYETQLSKEEGGSKRRRSRKQNSDAKPKSDKKAILLRKLAKDNYLMLDESHTAAGESNQGFYMQTLVRDSKAVTFASATYAKRPDTMPLYALRTAMSKANIGMKKLIEAIQKGGVTLQEIMSRALTNSGQMVRRERDMEGVVTDWTTIDDPETVKKARENYDKTIKAFNAIIDFQNKYIEPVINNKREDLAVIAGNAGFVKGTEKMGINNTPFASKTYNYTKQLMLALKVDAIVDEVDRQIKAGRKPVIALDNTMGALFDKLTPGDEVNESTFAENLLRGLDSVMQYSQDSGKGREKTSIRISPSELGTEGEAAYYELVSFIKESTKDIFISPLDEITAKLRAKGYNVGELTGRKNVVVEDNGTYRIAKRGKISKQLLQSRFNSGKIDVVILNKTGSTGISLHASKTFADQRQRVMILAQPLPDINDYMQMIGRIDRTGQVKRGYYINLGLPVPAEQRFLMMLSTKLKSLNANTTTSQESKDNKVEAPDMLNKYGSQVIVEYFKDHPDIYNKLDDPLNVKNKDGGLSGYKPSYDDEDARKLTGQVALLSTDEQQAFYDDVIERYNNLIKYLDDSGTNDLKITSLPLNATTLARAVSSEGNDPTGDNPFAQNAYVEKVEMDVLRKPMKANEINNVINTIAKGKDPKQAVEDIKAQYETEFKAKLDKQKRKYEADLERNKETLKKYEDKINGSEKMSEEDKRKAIDDKKESLQQDSDRKNDNAISSLEYEHERMTKALDLFKVGGSYLIPDNLDTLAFDLTSHGIFLGYKAKDNGITPSSTIAVFATLDGRRRVEIKLSEGNKIANVNTTTNQNYDAAQQVNLTNWDNNIPNITRKTGYIITGNILQAINDSQDENGNFTGQLVSYTDSEGNIHDGVLMPDKWEPTMMVNAGNPISSAKADIESGKTVISINGEVEIVPVISRYNPTAIYLRVPRSKKLGAKYYENEDLIRAIDEKEFYQNSGKLQTAIPNGKLDEVLSVLSKMGVKVPSDIVKQLTPQQSDNSLAYSSSTNNVNNPRIIPEDVDKDVSLQIESEFDDAIKDALEGLSEDEKAKVLPYIDNTIEGWSFYNHYFVLSEYDYVSKQVEHYDTIEKESKENGNIERQNEVASFYFRIKKAKARIDKAVADREVAYRNERTRALADAFRKEIVSDNKERNGETSQIPIEIVASVFKSSNKDEILNKLFDKVYDICRRVGTEFHAGQVESENTGAYSPEDLQNTIYFNIAQLVKTSSSNLELPVVILHEMLHQGTVGAINLVRKGKAKGVLTKEQIDAVNTIIDIYNKAKGNKEAFSDNPYGLQSPYEFAAQMADPRQRRALSMSPLQRVMAAANELKAQGNNSLWERIKNALKTLFGLSDLKKMDNAINTLLDTFNETVHDISMNDVDQNGWGYTSTQLFDKYPTWLSGQTTGTGQHTTQITSTVNTYKKIGEWMKSQGMKGASVLDASSGLGKGTEALRDMGFNVEDVEPYPSETRTKPTYLKYEDIKGKYDVVISNAVLNVIPDDWRADVLKNMADKVKPGGKLIINVRDAKEIEKQKQKIELDSPSEILVTDKVGNIRAYQKGFTQKELANWIQSELGEGWTIETANPSNSGISGRAVVVTRNTETPLRYRKVSDSMQKPQTSEESKSRMRDAAASLAKSLNTPIKIVTSDKAPEEAKNAKGYYDTRTGEVVIVLDNNQSVLDIEKTVVHEIIGHHGLRGLLGSVRNYRRLMDVIYNSLSEEQKNEIKDKTMRNGYKFYEAMDEYFAEQAENMVWDSSSATMWDNIKHYITEAIRKLGFILRPNYRDVRYWLWLSKNNLQSDNPLSEIKRQAFLHKLSRLDAPKFDDNFNKTEGDINYTDVDTAFRNGNIQGGTAWQIIEQRLKDNKQYWKESFVDYMNSYRIFQEEMAKGIEGGLMDNMNAYLGENQMSSKVAELQDQFLNNEVKNLQKQIDELKTEFGKGEEGVRALEQYLIMKHGLERNRVLFVRDWFNNNIRETVTESDLPEEAKLILENKQIDIETRFEDGDITEEQRDKLLKQAPQEAWEEYVNDKFNKFTTLHSQLADNVDRGLISLQDMYTRLDANINSFADFDPNNNDKSGLSAMTEYFVDDNYSDDAIVQQVMSIDEMLGDRKTNLWNAVEAVTQKGLDYDFMSGIVGEEAYNRAKTMFRWYIPLRGMDQKTMEDQYTYIQNSSGIGKKSLVTAKGRTTLAKSPLSTATQMGLSAISRGERNINKQRAYRLVNRWLKENENEMPPATIVDVWYEITGTDINGNPKMEIAIPPITDDMNDEQIRATVAIFNQRMKDLKRQGLAMNNKIPVEHMRPFDSKNHKSEHIVFVNINGKQKMIVFNGNPRPAQALNGDLNPSNSDNLFKKLMRIMAAAFTSYNPTFLATNLSRDILFSNSNVSIKEGKNYWLKFTKNQSMLLGNFATKYRKLWKDYNNGVQPTTDMGRYFEEFMKNGGKTGFVNQKKIDELQRMLYNNDKKEFAAKSLSMVFEFIENMNDRVENMNRFAAYVTSREMGRSVMRSINDAKEVSVNFNRKGAGSSTAKGENVTPAAKLAGSVGGAFRSSYLFFNAGIQSFYTLARNIENHPFKTSAYAMAVPFIAGSFLVPMLNKIIGLIFGDDGDDEYANIPEWTRRNNICIYLTNGNWAKIPLPIELRAFYGLGDIAAGYTIDERLQSTQNLGIDITSQLSQILPVDFMGEGGNVLAAFVPDVIKPVVQIMTNTDWTGKPIQKATTPFNKYDPEYTKAFKYEFEPFVKLSKNINNLTGGTDVTKGWYDGWWNSPAYWNHLIGGYGGGFVQDIMRIAKTSERLLTRDFDEWSIKEIPILKALFETPTERTQYYRTMNKFQMYRDEAAKSKHDLNKWRKSEDPLLKARFIHDTNKATKPNYVKRMELVDKYLRFENRANKIIDSPRVEEIVKKAKKEELTKAKIELVKKLDELE